MKERAPAFPGAMLTDHVDADELPRGQVTRLRVELTHDGLGRPLRLPVLVARGRRDGPTFGLTAAVHGNELNGIPVIHALIAGLDLQALRGAVVAVVAVNVPGAISRQRGLGEGGDLNHLFPGRPEGSPSEVFAYRLLDRVVRRLRLLVDLHTASFGRVNSLYVRADMTAPATAQMAYLQRPRIIVHNPAVDHTLRGAAQSLGIPAITLEIGDPQRFQHDLVRRACAGIRAVIGQAGMLPLRPVRSVQPILCLRSAWTHTDQGGLLEVHPTVGQRVARGQRLATMTSVFGDLVRVWDVPEDAVVVGKSVDPIAETGARIAHLGIEAPDDHPFCRRDDALRLVD